MIFFFQLWYVTKLVANLKSGLPYLGKLFWISECSTFPWLRCWVRILSGSFFFFKEITTPSTQKPLKPLDVSFPIYHLTMRGTLCSVMLWILFYLDGAEILCNVTTHSWVQSVWRINEHDDSYSQLTGGNLSLNVSSPGPRPWTVNIEPNACS